MIRYASSEDTLRRLSNPRAIKLKLFGTTLQFMIRETLTSAEGARR